MTTELDPFETRMIFLRVGWMNKYDGITEGDGISGGGSYIAQHGFGHEIFNFRNSQGKVYGYGQPGGGREDRWQHATVNLNRLGASDGEESLSNVLVVWVAKGFVVGWYQNATVYRRWQNPPPGVDRLHKDTDCGYYVTAPIQDAVRLPLDERTFSVPQKQGGMGQCNVWYADDPDQHREFRLKLLHYIQTRQLPDVRPRPGPIPPRQPDTLMRLKVEQVAVNKTWEYFENLGYQITDVQCDHVGWDLEAVLNWRELKLEVKGLAATDVVVELTPNEYAMMKQHRDAYRVCVVTNALNEPQLSVFARSPESGRWENDRGEILAIEDIIGARCSVRG